MTKSTSQSVAARQQPSSRTRNRIHVSRDETGDLHEVDGGGGGCVCACMCVFAWIVDCACFTRLGCFHIDVKVCVFSDGG